MQEVTGPLIERTERRRLLLQAVLVCCIVLVAELGLAGPALGDPCGAGMVVATGRGGAPGLTSDRA